ncbi:helix-turn-helix domain-containing protein [Micromonospora sp. STR1s_5]|nr:helix-turn-helix domain-containing protein [Micromonospora sp. STR1s_5]
MLEFLGHRFSEQEPEFDFGRWLADRRKRAGLSQDKLCALANVSKPAMVKLEHGRGHIATLLRVAEATGMALKFAPLEPTASARVRCPTVRIVEGDCRVAMQAFADRGVAFDAIVCDPPYHLSTVTKRFGKRGASPLSGGEQGGANPYRTMATGFLEQAWDGSGIAFDQDTWRAAYLVLKPGAYLVAFGGSRTFHRLAVAIEDAGFEIRDTIMWVYGSGFPKSKNLKGQHEGWGSALKPAFEPILVARKPLSSRCIAANVIQFGTGALNIDGCRVPTDAVVEQGRAGRKLGASVALAGPGLPGTASAALQGVTGNDRPRTKGRWPANFLHDGSDPVLAGFPGLGERSAARFFYAAKASRDDRGAGNKHPTVKPNDLTRYLLRLVTPLGGTVFDPFLGSGSTAKAAVQEGFSAVGCEVTPEYVEIARRRLKAEKVPVVVERGSERNEEAA